MGKDRIGLYLMVIITMFASCSSSNKADDLEDQLDYVATQLEHALEHLENIDNPGSCNKPEETEEGELPIHPCTEDELGVGHNE